jgi:chromate reductase, NAD(P)H dehydrogenase (quinone)
MATLPSSAPPNMKVLAISGSLRRDSLNTRLLRAAAELAPSGVEVELLDASVLKELPLYDADDDGAIPPVAARRLRGAIRLADALLIATPEYNGTIPGGLKNAIDWASRPRDEAALKHKPAAVVGASTGLFGAVWAQAETRKSLAIAGARVLEQEFPLGEADSAFGDDGLLAEPELNERLAEILGALTEHTTELAAAA